MNSALFRLMALQKEYTVRLTVDLSTPIIFLGQRNNLGEPHGRGTIYYDKLKKEKFNGRFNNGIPFCEIVILL